MKKPNYILEDQNEAQRLEEQSRLPQYDYVAELAGVHFSGKEKLLDAGCGSGIVSRYLAQQYAGMSVTATDVSELRLAQAKKLARGLDIKFETWDLAQAPSDKLGRFDKIICRYVMQHLLEPARAIQNLKSLLAPHGQLILIDVAGAILELRGRNQKLRTYLNEIKRKIPIDLYIGSKLKKMLAQQGFEDVEEFVHEVNFSVAERVPEIENSRQRFTEAFGLLVSILGSEKKAREFVELYLDELSQESCEYRYKKMTVVGTF